MGVHGHDHGRVKRVSPAGSLRIGIAGDEDLFADRLTGAVEELGADLRQMGGLLQPGHDRSSARAAGDGASLSRRANLDSWAEGWNEPVLKLLYAESSRGIWARQSGRDVTTAHVDWRQHTNSLSE